MISKRTIPELEKALLKAASLNWLHSEKELTTVVDEIIKKLDELKSSSERNKSIKLIFPDINIKNKITYTDSSGNKYERFEGPALHCTIIHNLTLLAEKLINAGANLNLKDDKNHFTPLMYAAQTGNLPIVKKLYEAGADLNIKSGTFFMWGKTALEIAINAGQTECIEFLNKAQGKKTVQFKSNYMSVQSDSPITTEPTDSKLDFSTLKPT